MKIAKLLTFQLLSKRPNQEITFLKLPNTSRIVDLDYLKSKFQAATTVPAAPAGPVPPPAPEPEPAPAVVVVTDPGTPPAPPTPSPAVEVPPPTPAPATTGDGYTIKSTQAVLESWANGGDEMSQA